jgi:hypothetical protein
VINNNIKKVVFMSVAAAAASAAAGPTRTGFLLPPPPASGRSRKLQAQLKAQKAMDKSIEALQQAFSFQPIPKFTIPLQFSSPLWDTDPVLIAYIKAKKAQGVYASPSSPSPSPSPSPSSVSSTSTAGTPTPPPSSGTPPSVTQEEESISGSELAATAVVERPETSPLLFS